MKPPVYNGPTNAEQFAEDMAARRALNRLDLPMPPQLRFEAIVGRYAYVGMERENGRLAKITFIDGSVVTLTDRDSWAVSR